MTKKGREVKVSINNIKHIVNRVYTYLIKFKDDCCPGIDPIYVTSNIIFGDTTEVHKKRIKEVLNL